MLVKLVGIITIEQNGLPTRSLSSAQTQVAFARLTLERSNGTRRDQLADTVWPEGPPDTWASALRSVVSRVRAFVTGSDEQDSTVLVAQGGRYLLRLPDDVTVDVERAEADVHTAAQACAAGAFAEARKHTAAAIACLRTQFLPEHEGEWVSSVRERLDGLLVLALETASLAAASLGDGRDALRCAEEAVRRAPLRESAHRCRMAAHVAAGNRAEALRSYNVLRRALADELGVDPAPETQAAYLELLSSPSPRSGGGTGGAPATRSAPAVPFVGRETELGILHDEWVRAERGDTRLVLLCGPSGVGKTRLATMAARQISLGGGVVMFGRCDPQPSLPYQQFASALTDFVAATPADTMPPLRPGPRATLHTLTTAGGVESGGVSRAAWLTSLGELFADLVADRAALLVIDGLDAAGDEAASLLRYLQRFERSGLLVVGTVNPGADASGVTAAVVRDLAHTDGVQRMDLRGLDEQHVVPLLRQFRAPGGAGPLPSPHQLIADTAGNPFLLLELLRAHGNGDAAGLSPAIHEHAAARLAVLDPASVLLLRAAAVAGRTFELDLVAYAAELDEGRAMDCLDVLVQHGMAVEVPTSPGSSRAAGYQFTYDLLRRSIYERLNHARRRWLHTRLADAIELRRADQLGRYSRVLAHHRAVGATPHGDQRAVFSGWRAAATASAAGAATDAVRLHRQALDHVPPGDEEVRAEALTNLGLAQLAAGDPECDKTLLDGAIRAMHSGRLNVAASAAIGLADAVQRRPSMRGEAVALIGVLVEAAARPGGGPWTLVPLDDVTLGRLLARQAQLGGQVRADPPARAALDALARELRSLEGRDQVHHRLATAREVLGLATAIEDHQQQMLAAHHLATATDATGDLTARDEALAALGAAGAAGGPRTDQTVDTLLSEHAVALAATQGRFTDAMVLGAMPGTQGALPVPGVSPAPGSVAPRQLVVTDWLRGTGMQDQQPPTDVAAEALAALSRGERGVAHLRMRALATGVLAMPDGDLWLHAAGTLALGVHELGDPSTAEATHALLLPYADLTCGVGYRSFAGPVSLHLGRLSVVMGDWSGAERYLSTALTALADRHARPWIALAQQSLAQALQGRARDGDHRWAVALEAEADRMLTSLGAAVNVRR